MAYLNTTSTAPMILDRLRGSAAKLYARYLRHRTYRATLDGLSALSDRDLNDLGLSRSGLRATAWDAANR